MLRGAVNKAAPAAAPAASPGEASKRSEPINVSQVSSSSVTQGMASDAQSTLTDKNGANNLVRKEETGVQEPVNPKTEEEISGSAALSSQKMSAPKASASLKIAVAKPPLPIKSVPDQSLKRMLEAKASQPPLHMEQAIKVPYHVEEVNRQASLPPPDKGGSKPDLVKDERAAAPSSHGMSAEINDWSDATQGWNYLRSGNLGEAEKTFQKTFAANNRASTAYRRALEGMVSICMAQHRDQAGLSYALEVKKYVKPGSLEEAANHKEIGDCAYALKNYRTADIELSLARDGYKNLHQLPGWCNLTRRLARVKCDSGDYAAASALYKEESDYRRKIGDNKLADRALADAAACQSELKTHQTGP
jgi:tetratricopeptide (TPR) repeat protein